jgi:DNA-binding CsgD family transcriptional regulator/tetratricopeptide (TPR) repeat protein
VTEFATLDPRGPGCDTSPVGHRMACGHFVGRRDSLSLLDASFDQARAERASMVLVEGDAGIGKSRLVGEFCQRLGEDVAVATGACVPMIDGGLPYAPVVGILRTLGRRPGPAVTDGPLDTLLARPQSSDPGPRASRGGLDDTLAKTMLFESILGCLVELAHEIPVVLVFEDLQWADSATGELLHFLVRNLDDARVLILGTYRGDELGRDHPLRGTLDEIGRSPTVGHIRLDGLARDETAELIEAILGQAPDWTLLDAVSARSQGNPFFVEELTAARHSPTLQPELREVVTARVQTLPDETQHLLQLVAAAGASAEHRLVAAVSTLDGDALDRALAEVVDRQILVVDTDAAGYRFRHALLREAVYATLLPGTRDRLHRAIADALTGDPTLGPTDPGARSAELAAHWWAAGQWVDACRESVESGRAAAQIWAFPEAHAHLERALASLDHMPDADVAQRLAVLEQAADMAYLARDSARAVDLTLEAIQRVDPGTDPAHAAWLRTMLGRNTWGVGDSGAAFDAYRQAIEMLPADQPSSELAWALAERGRGLMVMSRFREGEDECRRAIEVARAVGDRAVEGHAINTLGCCIAGLGRSDDGVVLVREALEIAEGLASADDLNRAYGNLAGLLLEADRLEEAAALIFDSTAAGYDIWGVALESTVSNSTDALIRLGRYADAEGILAQAGRRGIGICVASPDMKRMTLAMRQGNLEEASRLQEVADGLTTGMSDVQQRGLFHLLGAELALECGRPEEALTHVEGGIALAATTDDEELTPELCAFGVRAVADWYDARRPGSTHPDADKLRLRGLELSDQVAGIVRARADRGADPAQRMTAFAATCEAERSRMHVQDPALWARAAAEWEAIGEPHPYVYCLLHQADALLQGRSSRSAASHLLDEAARVSRRVGMPLLMARIEQLARRARITLHEEEAEPDHRSTVGEDLGLTPREVEVLGLLALGRTDREIADELFISKKTASVHVSNILRKLDVANRVEAGRIGQTHLDLDRDRTADRGAPVRG